MGKRFSQMTLYVTVLLTFGVAPIAVQAQQAPVFLQVACFKALPGKGAEFQDFLTGDARKLAQASIDLGQSVRWTASRTVIPVGEDADCDFTTARTYRGMPSSLRLVSDEALAKVNMKRDDLLAKVGSMARLRITRLWRAIDAFGEMNEGDYYTVDLMDVSELSEWIELETKIYKPVHQERAKSGPIKAWSAYALYMPRGSGLPFNAGTVNVFKDLKSFGGPSGSSAAFEKVHPEVNRDWLRERTRKARDIVQSILAQVIARVAAQ